MHPSYLESYQNGKLKKIVEKTHKMLASCCLCPRKCKINRLKGELGFCKTGMRAKLYSYLPHHGEEPPISGSNGSGTIFFSSCNMACVYCQNSTFSQIGQGRELEAEDLRDVMLQLQNAGCHNINLVTPTHIMPQILKALQMAVPAGLKIPIVYNTSGYELAGIIKLLEGVIDIFLADMRYADKEPAYRYSSAAEYPRYNQAAIKQMHKQAGIAKIDKNGIIKSGLIVRHLVLPNGIAGTKKIMYFIANEVSKKTFISLMSQYLPCYKSPVFEEINRRITSNEYRKAREDMEKSGLYNGWTQESHGLKRYAGTNIKPSANT